MGLSVCVKGWRRDLKILFGTQWRRELLSLCKFMASVCSGMQSRLIGYCSAVMHGWKGDVNRCM